MTSTPASQLSEDELVRFGAELDALRERTVATLGVADVAHIRRMLAAVRWCSVLGRSALFLGAFLPFVRIPAWIVGVILLAAAKILENMEVGHNIIHGQYDWTGDPRLDGRRYEWDIVATAENWRKTHNFQHHTYTNVRGMDDDIGYGLLRIFPEQRWQPGHLLQPLTAIVLAMLFQWGVAIQALKMNRWLFGRMKTRDLLREASPVLRKAARQLGKDYVLFPLLAGPFFMVVLTGHLAANLIRNLWTCVIIFCGHFTAEVETFPRQCLRNETRGHWYLRQLLGSSNIRGGRWLDIFSGNLSHQIEHHFFPDIPASRYAEMAREVREICARYGLRYNSGSLPKQVSQVAWRVLRHAFPSRPKTRFRMELPQRADSVS